MSSHKHPENEDQSPDDSPKEQGGAASPESAPAAEGPFAEQLLKLQAENKDLLNTLVRRQADFENYRKRVEKERQTDRHRGVEHLIEKILPVLDALEKALSTDGAGEIAEFRKGFELIYRQLWDVLSKQGLKRIESAGKAFDPHFHHAIQQVETSDVPDGQVLDELQPGYLFHDRVLRPAMVRVSSAPAIESVSDVKRRN